MPFTLLKLFNTIPEFINITWIQKSKSHFLNFIHTNQVAIHYKYISISLILLLLPFNRHGWRY